MYACVYVCMYVCVLQNIIAMDVAFRDLSACMCVCMFDNVCVCMHVCACKMHGWWKRLDIVFSECIHMYNYVCMHTWRSDWWLIHKYTQITHTWIWNVYMCVFMYVCMHICIHENQIDHEYTNIHTDRTYMALYRTYKLPKLFLKCIAIHKDHTCIHIHTCTWWLQRQERLLQSIYGEQPSTMDD